MTRIQAEGPSRPASQALWQSPRVLVFDRYFSNKSMFCVCVWMHNISKCKWMPFKQHSMRVSGKLFACCHCNVCVYHKHVCHMFSCIVFPWCRLVISFFLTFKAKIHLLQFQPFRSSLELQNLNEYQTKHKSCTMNDTIFEPCTILHDIHVRGQTRLAFHTQIIIATPKLFHPGGG